MRILCVYVEGCRYGIGSAPPYFAAGYVPQSKWYQLGFLLSIYYIAVWLFVGGAWWKVGSCQAPSTRCDALCASIAGINCLHPMLVVNASVDVKSSACAWPMFGAPQWCNRTLDHTCCCPAASCVSSRQGSVRLKTQYFARAQKIVRARYRSLDSGRTTLQSVSAKLNLNLQQSMLLQLFFLA